MPSSPALFQPATFAERGVAVPFTTPVLAGVRARQDPRSGLVLVLPNRSGIRGVYVVPWSAMREECQPTLHDCMLNEAIAASEELTPATVRAVARSVAVAGAAGRVAQAAAVDALRTEAASRAATAAYLAASWPGPPDPTAMATLALALDGLGIGPAPPRLPAQLARLLRFAEDAVAAAGDEDGTGAYAAALAVQAARCASHVLAAAQAFAADRTGLAEAWAASPAGVLALAARPAWVLDGWTLPLLLWNRATDAMAQRVALAELGPLLAPLPAEATGWMDTPHDVSALPAWRRGASPAPDWRHGLATLDLVARNEQFRGLAA